jgi:transposase
MTDQNQNPIDRDLRKKVVADYLAGRKLRQIEEDHGTGRSVVYRILKNADVAPSRVKQSSRDNAGDQEATTTMLFKLVEQQDRRIQQLEKFCAEHKLEIPEP